MLTIKQNQNLLDMVVQHTGQLDNLFLLAQLNALSITGDLVAGHQLQEVPVTDKRVVNLFAKKEYDCTTFLKPVFTQGGIGFMKIGTSFIVS